MTSKPSEKALDARQMQAVRLLASGLTQRETATRLGVTTRTVERWNSLKAFKDAVSALTGTVPLITRTSPQTSPQITSDSTQAFPNESVAALYQSDLDFLSNLPDRCFEPIKSLDDADADVLYQFTRNAWIQSLELLLPLVFLRLRRILENPDIRVSDQLKAAELLGRWAGLNEGLSGSINRVFSAGYTISE